MDNQNEQGGEAAVNALFTGTPATEATEPQQAPPQQATESQPKEEEWRPGFVPKAFRDETGAFNGNMDGLFKSWSDGRAHISNLEAELSALRAGSGAAGVPDTDEEYLTTFDFDALSKRAPRAYAGGGAENPVVANLLKLGHTHGVPVKAMQALVSDYFAGMNEHIPETKTATELRSEATAYLGPNGAQIMSDIQGRLAARARAQPFSEEKLEVVKQLLEWGPGAALLHELLASGTTPSLPNSDGVASAVNPEDARAQARRGLGTLDDAEWQRRKNSAIAEYNRVHAV